MSRPTKRKFKEGKKTFTSGDVAYLLDVTIHTAAKMMTEGPYDPLVGPPTTTLHCFRLPGGGFRRVTREDLVAFLKRANMFKSLEEIGEVESHEPSESEGNQGPSDLGGGRTELGEGLPHCGPVVEVQDSVPEPERQGNGVHSPECNRGDGGNTEDHCLS